MPQNPVAFKVAKTVIDLFEAVQVAHHHGQRSVQALAPSQFAVKMDKQRARVRQLREVIRGGRTLSLLERQCILHGKRDFGTDGKQDAQMV